MVTREEWKEFPLHVRSHEALRLLRKPGVPDWGRKVAREWLELFDPDALRVNKVA